MVLECAEKVEELVQSQPRLLAITSCFFIVLRLIYLNKLVRQYSKSIDAAINLIYDYFSMSGQLYQYQVIYKSVHLTSATA